MNKFSQLLIFLFLFLGIIGSSPTLVQGCSVVSGTYNNFRIFDIEGNVLANHELSLGIDASCQVTNQWIFWGGNQIIVDIDDDGKFDLIEIDDSRLNYKVIETMSELPLGRYQDDPVFLNDLTKYNPIESYTSSENYVSDLIRYNMTNEEVDFQISFTDFENSKILFHLTVSNKMENDYYNVVYNVLVRLDVDTQGETMVSTSEIMIFSSFSTPDFDPSGRYFVYNNFEGNTVIFDLQEKNYTKVSDILASKYLAIDGIWIESNSILTLIDYNGVQVDDSQIEMKSNMGPKFMVLDDYIVTIHLESNLVRNLDYGFDNTLFTILIASSLYYFRFKRLKQ